MNSRLKEMEKLDDKFTEYGYNDAEALEELLEKGYTREDFEEYGNLEWAERTAEDFGIEF